MKRESGEREAGPIFGVTREYRSLFNHVLCLREDTSDATLSQCHRDAGSAHCETIIAERTTVTRTKQEFPHQTTSANKRKKANKCDMITMA